MLYSIIKALIKISGSIALVILFMTSIFIVADGLINHVDKSDIIVILGNRVELDGTPSLRLKSRLDKGLEVYKNGFSPLIFVSGGIGREGYDEAKVMKDYLVSQGVPEQKVVADSKGVDSFNTARNAKYFMNENNLSSVIVVSNYYHISRTKLAFSKFGVNKIYSAHADYFELRDIYSIAREVVGYYYYIVR
jgi:uncharacterized SAM-binding protein YcdF (DUF218 family)